MVRVRKETTATPASSSTGGLSSLLPDSVTLFRHQVPNYLVPVGRVLAMSSGCPRRRRMRQTNSKDGHNGGFSDHSTDGATSGERCEPRR